MALNVAAFGAGKAGEAMVNAALSGLGDPLSAWAEVHRPENQNMLIAVSMAASLIMCFAGHRLLTIWLFLAGFASLSMAFYTFSPTFLRFDFCCKPGSGLERVALSAAFGVIGGLLALFVLRVGIFLTGCCMGFLVSMLLMMTPLGDSDFMDNSLAFGIVYLGLAIVGGIFALWAQRPFLLVATSCGGALTFFLTLDSIIDAHIAAIANELGNRLMDAVYGVPFRAIKMSTHAYVLLFAWIALSIAGIIVQVRSTKKSDQEARDRDRGSDDDDDDRKVVLVVDRQGTGRSVNWGRSLKSSRRRLTSRCGACWRRLWCFGSNRARRMTGYQHLDDRDLLFEDEYDEEDFLDGSNDTLSRSRATQYKKRMEQYKMKLVRLKDRMRNNGEMEGEGSERLLRNDATDDEDEMEEYDKMVVHRV